MLSSLPWQSHYLTFDVEAYKVYISPIHLYVQVPLRLPFVNLGITHGQLLQ